MVVGGILLVSMVVGSAVVVKRSARGRMYDSVETVPKRRVGLVLGCSEFLRGRRRSAFFATRMKAAAALFHGDKVDYLLVSGDNHRVGYDEPSDMKRALQRLGVPEANIYCDYAGFRTFDSVVRARKVFGQQQVTIVSQAFHNERAIFIARDQGLDAIGFNASAVRGRKSARTHVRELFARVKTVLDIYALRTRPRFLGKRIVIRGE